LGKAKVPKAGYEYPDGSPLKIDKDFFGHIRTVENSCAGPFVDLAKDKVILKVW
jgi:hypothetical protein